MPQPDAKPSAAVLVGPSLALMEGLAPTLAANIGRRAAEKPRGLLRSLQPDGEIRTLTFAEAWRRSGFVSASLRAAAIGPGFQVLLVHQDILDFVPAYWACLRVGATAVPFTTLAKTAQTETLAAVLARLERPAILSDRLEASADRLKSLAPGAQLVVVDAAASDETTEEFQDGKEADFPCLIATSGSTGAVKLAQLSGSAILHRHFSRNYSGPAGGQHCLGVFPFDGLAGLRAVYLNYASYSQMHPSMLAGRPQAILQAVQDFGATHVQMTNSMAARLVECGAQGSPRFDLASLKSIGLGGEAVSRLTSIAFASLLKRCGAHDVLRAGYGATETGPLLAGADPSVAPLDDAGAIILGGCAAGVSLRIVDDEGRTIEEGGVGHVEALTPQTAFSGYCGEADPEDSTSDGWWKSGDLGRISDGGFSFRGRAKQTLVINGRKFSLTDMDARLQSEARVEGAIHTFVVRRPEDPTDNFGVAISLDGSATVEERSQAIRSAALRCYGAAPFVVLTLGPDELPLTATGKVDRRALGERALAVPPPAPPPAWLPAEAGEANLEALWREALNWTGELDRNRRFDDSGGDSLRVVSLLMGVEQKFARRVSLAAFYENPTFERLAALVDQAPAVETPAAPSFWPLQDELHRGLLYHLESWPGARPTEDRLLLLLNEQGDRPPLFGIFNAGHEFVDLGRDLGPGQPLYGLRSTYEVGRRDEDDIQAVALRYVRDILAVSPEGPFFLLGQCQGGRIALAVAEHLRRRERRVPLLILIEWEAEKTFYADPVVLLYGRDSVLNPRLSHPGAKPDFGRFFPLLVEDEVDGVYGQLYSDENIASLSGQIVQRCRAVLEDPPRAFDAALPAIRVSVNQELGPLLCRRRFRLDVELAGVEAQTIDGDKVGLWLGAQWRRQEDGSIERAARVPVPAIASGQSVKVAYRATAPTRAGVHDFFLDIFEEGRIHRREPAEAPFRATVEVLEPGRWRRLQQLRLWAQRLRNR